MRFTGLTCCRCGVLQGGQVQIFVDAMQRRQDLNNKLMTDRQRDAMRWEQQHSRDEARIADRDTEIAQLKVAPRQTRLSAFIRLHSSAGQSNFQRVWRTAARVSGSSRASKVRSAATQSLSEAFMR